MIDTNFASHNNSLSRIVQAGDTTIENQCNMTIVFPDNDLPERMNGGFDTQQEFLDFVAKHQKTGSWSAELHFRPDATRVGDWKENTIARAFPKVFPYGFTGLPGDPALAKLEKREGYKKHMKRNRVSVLKKYLQMRQPAFHEAKFNLIVCNTILKETIFTSSCIRANMSVKNAQTLAGSFGRMTGGELMNAISASRNRVPSRYSSRPGSQYLNAIHAICRSLPHTNEATEEARRIYFSYLIKFGLPCIFFTITPDDSRNFRIIAYSLEKKVPKFGEIKIDELTDDEILADFRFKSQQRLKYPGLCAEEYARVTQIIIQHVLNWDEKEEKSKGPGLFGDLAAWCLATEEQGRKTLHGHYLLFVKGWNDKLKHLHTNSRYDKNDITGKMVLSYFDSNVSARLFSEFDSSNPEASLTGQAVFYHQNCGSTRQKARPYNIIGISKQIIREMRHKKKWREHAGKVATCGICESIFTIQSITSAALNYHCTTRKGSLQYPDHNHRLESFVYEEMKDFNWYQATSASKARRYFMASTLFNIHRVEHTTRCFKGGKSECYADLPEDSSEKSFLQFCEEPDWWTNYLGVGENRYMFKYVHARRIEDSFMNNHQPLLTKVFQCNTNVLQGLSGKTVFYVTNYASKNQQTEETEAFKMVSQRIIKTIENQQNQVSLVFP